MSCLLCVSIYATNYETSSHFALLSLHLFSFSFFFTQFFFHTRFQFPFVCCAFSFLYIKIPFDAIVLQRYIINVTTVQVVQDAEWAREKYYPYRRYAINRLYFKSSKYSQYIYNDNENNIK